jgi:hypothetical protein
MPVFSSEPLHLHVHTSEAVQQHRIWSVGTYIQDPWYGQVTGLHVVQQRGVVQAWLTGRNYTRASALSCLVDGHILDCVDSADPDGVSVTVVWSPDSAQLVVARSRERSFYGSSILPYMERFAVQILVDSCTPTDPNPTDGMQCVDTDGDGLSDYFERLTPGYDRFLTDADSDSVDDYTEHLRGTNPGAWDTYGDGVSDYSESLLGTDPVDSNE